VLWLEAGDDLVDFYQGLIQLAAAYHHMQRGTFSGAVRLFDAALQRLARFPQGFHGVDRSAAEAAAPRHRQFAERRESLEPGEYPKLILTTE
jgi:predicted metal-dependent hydrolase